jgi:Cohesin domain
MKRILLGVALGLLPFLGQTPAHAVAIKLIPATQEVQLGTSVEVKVGIEGLSDQQQPALSAFDLDISFDPLILQFSNAIFGDPILGDQLLLINSGFSAATPGSGTVNITELSFDSPSDLNALQANQFILATLVFNTKKTGISPLGLSINALGDENGNPLIASVANGTINVQAVPTPALAPMLSLTMGAVALRRKKSRVTEQAAKGKSVSSRRKAA